MGCEFNDDISLTKEDFTKNFRPTSICFAVHRGHRGLHGMGRDGLQTVRLHPGQLREGEKACSRGQGLPGLKTDSTAVLKHHQII